MHPYLDGIEATVAVAHRGADPSRENTFEAFASAFALGCRFLETDARATRDGVAVTVHDAYLRRVAGDRRAVHHLTWRDLQSVRVGGACAVPRLDDVLAAFPGVRFPIDVKEAQAVGPAARAVLRTGSLRRVCIGSFSDRRLRDTVGLLGPGTCYSLGPRGVAALLSAARRGSPLRTAALCAQLPLRLGPLRIVTRAVLDTCRSSGLPVFVWTVNDVADMTWLVEVGVDGIVTDDLAALVAVLGATR